MEITKGLIGVQDIHWWDGTDSDLTFSRVSSTGGTNTLNSVPRQQISSSQTLTTDMTITYAVGIPTLYFIDPNGADRLVNPIGSFPTSTELTIVNLGANLIRFNSTVLDQGIGAGQAMTFRYDGTYWR